MEISLTLPSGLRQLSTGQCWAFATEDAFPWLEGVLAGGSTLHEWAGRQPSSRSLSGRGTVYSVPAPVTSADAADRWVVRHYYRGGAMARLLGDKYLAVGQPRPLAEARAIAEALQRGIPTPKVVAGATYRGGILHYRADLVTEEIPDAADLAAVLFSEPKPTLDPEHALGAAGALVRRLELAGVLHPDMNAKNIVLQPVAGGAVAHLVDMDRCCPRVPGVPAPAFPMRRRLERSLRKFESREGKAIPSEGWSALRRGFGNA